MDHCYVCDGNIKVIKDKPYLYDECGLDVTLLGITQYKCQACGETYASIPNMNKLHRVIGANICEKRKALLQPEEIKFLRKDLHLRAKGLSQILGVTPQTLSRWENGKKKIGEAHDRLFRSIYMMYASEKAKHMVRDSVIDVFKALPAKRKDIKNPKGITLNPPEWLNCFGDSCPA
jgi:putative transcriptional regulator